MYQATTPPSVAKPTDLTISSCLLQVQRLDLKAAMLAYEQVRP